MTGTVHQVLVCRHLRPGSRDKQQSLVVALLRAKQERLLSSRKRWIVDRIVTIIFYHDVARSASECCLHSAPAPLCAGESNVTLALETRWVIISIQGHPQSLYRVIHNNRIFSLQVQRAAQL